MEDIYDLTDEQIIYKINRIKYLRNKLIWKQPFFNKLKNFNSMTYSEIFNKLKDDFPSEQVIQFDMKYFDQFNNILNSYKPNIKKCLLKLCDSKTDFDNLDYTYSDIKNVDDLIEILKIMNFPPEGFIFRRSSKLVFL
jgi:hypothetical protein